MKTLRILLNEYSPRTFNQYQGVWSRFIEFLSSRGIPAGAISEATVLDFLTSRLKPEGCKGRVKGKLSPRSLRTELYGLISPLKFQFGLEIDPTAKGSLIKRFITAALRLPSVRANLFPRWDVCHLTLLSSSKFEPM